MKQILLCLICLLFLETIMLGQEISRQEADSMLTALKKAKIDTERIELLLSLAQFHILKPGENKIDLDSAAACINQAKILNAKVNSANDYGYLLMIESCLMKERGNKAAGPTFFTSDSSKKMAENAVKILESGTNKNFLGQAYWELSMYYDYNDMDQLHKKTELIMRSVNAFEQGGDLKRKGRSQEMLGDLYTNQRMPDSAIIKLNQALKTYQSINYPKVQGVYALLGGTYLSQHDYPNALSNLLKALKAAKLTKDSSMQLCQINNYLGMMYNSIDRLDMAVQYLTEALTIARKNGDENALFYLAVNLSNTYNALNQPSEALKVLGYISKKFFEDENLENDLPYVLANMRTRLGLKRLYEAHRYCNLLLHIADEKSTTEGSKSNVYRYAGNYYFMEHQYIKARNYLVKSLAIARREKLDHIQIQDLELLYRLDSIQGNFRMAYDHLLEYKAKSDSVYSERKARQFQVMNVEYEVGMKEDSIKSKNKDILLLTQKNNLQQNNLKQASLIKNITIVGIVLALFIIGLLYRLYSQKQKSNYLLKLQKEEIDKKNQDLQQLNEQQKKLLVEKEWLIKEIHHRVKNNLQMVISLLNAQSEFLNNPGAIDAIKESRERMQAIAILHQKLYQLDNSTQVNMRLYVNELVDNIKNSFADGKRINFKIDADDVDLDISQSVPLGLILNEAITNAVKYAYAANENGTIQISLKQNHPDKLQLKISDNGKGIPPNINIDNSNSLGLQLIKLFSEQLEGEICFINNNGLEIILNFKTAKYKNVIAIKATA